jgi:hypothetical protein
MERKIFPFAKRSVPDSKYKRPLPHGEKSRAFVKMLFLPPFGEFRQFRLLSAPIIYLLHQKGF